MPIRKFDPRAFQAAWNDCGGHAPSVAKRLRTTERTIFVWRRRFEGEHGPGLVKPASETMRGVNKLGEPAVYNPRLTIEGFSGTAVIFSDAHFWPGISETTAYRALLDTIRELKPKLVIANGDVLDGARISRFPPEGWGELPRMSDELEEVKTRLTEIRHAYRGARHIRTIGNHDTRFDRYLAIHASDFEGIGGFRLKDHIPEWEECVATFVNGHTVIKHRFNGGIHAGYNNTLRAGTNIFTGHTHRLGVTAWGDYTGRRYGCETGSLAEIGGPQFSYAEQNPTPGCSGFAVGTFDKDGRLLFPELAEVIDGTCYFRGQRVVSERKKARAA